MQNLSEIRSILERRGIRPKHRLGQNFLHDQNQIRRLLEAAALEADELVVEVGPGTGTLTEALLEAGCSVIASELDEDMADIIDERLMDRIEVIRGDCLDGPRTLSRALDEAIGDRSFKLVANLPYGAASPLMSLLAFDPRCRGQYVTIQREVGDRLLAEPGTKTWGPLTISVRIRCDVELIGRLSPQCFWPAPKVDSVMVAITPRGAHSDLPEAVVSRVLRTLFTKRRKQLGTILGRNTALPNGITADRRPDSLSIDELVSLATLDVFGEDPGAGSEGAHSGSRR